MPRCFRTIEAGLGRAGLKVITNGTRTLLVQLPPIIFIYFKFVNFYVNGPVTYLLILLFLPLKICFANRNIGQFFGTYTFYFTYFFFCVFLYLP